MVLVTLHAAQHVPVADDGVVLLVSVLLLRVVLPDSIALVGDVVLVTLLAASKSCCCSVCCCAGQQRGARDTARRIARASSGCRSRLLVSALLLRVVLPASVVLVSDVVLATLLVDSVRR